MRYYIAVINYKLHMAEWCKLKTNLVVCGYSYVVYFDDSIKQIELNEVYFDVFNEMRYNDN